MTQPQRRKRTSHLLATPEEIEAELPYSWQRMAEAIANRAPELLSDKKWTGVTFWTGKPIAMVEHTVFFMVEPESIQ